MTWANSTKGLPARRFAPGVVLGFALLLSACASKGPEQATLASWWQCEDLSLFQVRQQGEHLWLQLPDSEHWHALSPARAASGSRYTHPDGLLFWSQGSRARIETPEQSWMQCQRLSQGDPTSLEHPQIVGADASPEAIVLSASGDQPRWRLTVRQSGEGEITLEFGTRRIGFDQIEMTHQDLIRSDYQARTKDGEPLRYQVENRICIDPGSGVAYQHRVTLHFQGQVLQGCGEGY